MDTESKVATEGRAESLGLRGLEAASRRAGWRTIEYRQLSGGRTRTHGSLTELGDVSVLHETTGHAIEGAGETESHVVHMLLPATPDRLALNGRWLGETGFGLFGPGGELQCTARTDVEVHTIEIPFERFARDIQHLLPDAEAPARGSVVAGEGHAAAIARLRELVLPAAQIARSAATEHELASAIVTRVAQVVAGPDRGAARHHRDPAGRQRVLRRAREFIEANLAGVIRMPDVCEAAGVSLKTLERVFRSELGITPIAYVRVRRLDAVRRELTSPTGRELPVGRVAINHGFRHLGRFAAAYRAHFGELPSRARTAA